MSDERRTVRVIGFEDAEIIAKWVKDVGAEITRLRSEIEGLRKVAEAAIRVCNTGAASGQQFAAIAKLSDALALLSAPNGTG